MVGWLIKNLLQGVQWHSYFILVQFSSVSFLQHANPFPVFGIHS